MAEPTKASAENRLSGLIGPEAASAQRALKNFRYLVGSVNQSALAAWADLWEQLQPHVTSNGMILPEAEHALQPACGWPEFLEKLWLLKHYLDYIHRLCRPQGEP